MTEHDDVIDLLRRAMPEDPPDELASPHALAAQAIFEEILSMQTIHPAESPPDLATAPSSHRRIGRPLAAAAAAALIAGVAAGFVVVGPNDPSAADVVEQAFTTTGDERSGRLDVSWEFPGIADPDDWPVHVPGGYHTYEFSGDDLQMVTHQPAGDVLRLLVDDHTYYYGPRTDENGAPNGPYEWIDTGPADASDVDPDRDTFELDPPALLDEFRPDGRYEDLGEEQVDDVTSRHFRALEPTNVDLDLGDLLASDVASFDVWVGDDYLIRRIEVGIAGGPADPATPTRSPVEPMTIVFRLYDFGKVTLEPPALDTTS